MKSRYLLLLLILASCSKLEKQKAERVTTEVDSSQASVRDRQFLSLRGFISCGETDLYLRDNFRRLIKESLDQQRFYLANPNQSGVSKSMASPVAASAESATSNDSASSAPGSFSKTNVQVEGVDESDIMKTDGTYIYTISRNTVQIVASWPVESMKRVAEIKLAGTPQEMFLTESKKLVIAYYVSSGLTSPEIGKPIPALRAPDMYQGAQVLKLAIYDVANPASPQLVKEHAFVGSYLSMRRQGDTIRLIRSDSLAMPETLKTYVNWDYSQKANLAEFDRLRGELETANENFLSQLTLKSYLAQKTRALSEAVAADLIYSDNPSCQNLFRSDEMGTLGLTTVTSLNLADGQIAQTSILAPANQVYASDTSLYLAHTQRSWWWGFNAGEGSKTYLHKFEYESPTSLQVLYQGSGVVGGWIINQFAMDEFEGHLRIAVTDDHAVRAINPSDGSPLFTTVSRVVVLNEIDGSLATVGQTPDLAKGETIYSARFKGKKGYVVTFRQTDPLFTLDLSNPKAPTVTGELKVNGFSSYIHMMDDATLLTVGQDADPATGRVTGLKVSLFDVSDAAHPTEKFTYLFSDLAYANSQAQYDHHAFTYFAERGLLGLPIGGYKASADGVNWWNAYFSELRVLEINKETGIKARGSIAMNDLFQGTQQPFYDWWNGSQVRRSVFADDYVYAISEAGVRAVKNQDFATPIATARFYP